MGIRAVACVRKETIVRAQMNRVVSVSHCLHIPRGMYPCNRGDGVDDSFNGVYPYVYRLISYNTMISMSVCLFSQCVC